MLSSIDYKSDENLDIISFYWETIRPLYGYKIFKENSDTFIYGT